MGRFRDQGWRLVGLGVRMGGFRNQGAEMGGFRDQGWRWVGLGIRGGDGWVEMGGLGIRGGDV